MMLEAPMSDIAVMSLAAFTVQTFTSSSSFARSHHVLGRDARERRVDRV